MNIKSNIVNIAVALVAFIAIAIWSQGHSNGALAGQGGPGASSCTMSATTSVIVGNQSSTIVVPAYAQNAFARIQQPLNATNTVRLGFGVAAVPGVGTKLGLMSSSSIPDSITFGLNTDLPFTGSVSAITDLGSTTVDVIICRY